MTGVEHLPSIRILGLGRGRCLGDLSPTRLFVVDQSGVLVGVISALDLLRHLSEEA